ncbi:MAG TPA: transglutaminase-like domain-containing protein [Candidatus Acidoferrum sp.]|nr:transglutaminase-like domain-containing protein [Candidatus Acidoferrum sp.]
MRCTKPVTAVAVLLSLSVLSAAFLTPASPDSSPTPSRSFEFSYVVHVPALPAGSHELHLWIPLPYHERYQIITREKIESPVRFRIYTEPEYHDRYAYLVLKADQAKQPVDIKISFHAVRYEHSTPLSVSSHPAVSAEYSTVRFLEPDRLVPSNPQITEISDQVTQGVTDPVDKARKLYEYVIAHMHYDHDGTEWGRGDAVWACDSHHGNCTDFHSLFIALARAQKIPAGFEIGFPLPADKHEGAITSYHCWALFYAKGVGWVPIDASEAWKHKDKQDYFFGAVDQNRIKMSLGRDIRLNPPQVGAPLNYFVFPYAELDGQPYKDLKNEYSFSDDPAPPANGVATGSD